MAKKKRLTMLCVCKDVEELELSCGSNGSCRMVQPPWETLWLFLINDHPYDPAILLPVMYLREMKTHRHRKS